jgi:hypothetical protein
LTDVTITVDCLETVDSFDSLRRTTLLRWLLPITDAQIFVLPLVVLLNYTAFALYHARWLAVVAILEGGII